MKSLLTIGFLLLVLTFAQAFRVAHRLQTQTGLEKGGEKACSDFSAEECPKDRCRLRHVIYGISVAKREEVLCG